MFLESFKITGSAVAQIFLLGAVGFCLFKRQVFGAEGLTILSRLVVEVTLPLFIFCQLIKDFRFDLYPKWWLFPILSIAITVFGLLLGYLFSTFIHGEHHKTQFVSLVAFQNSGYLPLALIKAILPADKSGPMLIYLILFLLGFNLVVWSFGVHMLSSHENKKFELGTLFSPPVIAVLAGLVAIILGVNKFFPGTILKPMQAIGECTVPLAMFVVGGSLAAVKLKHVDKKAMALLILAKLLIMPAIGFALILKLKLPELIGLFILMQLAVPPATSLAVIAKHYRKEDLLISQGIFFGHIVGMVSVPLFLSLYFALVMIR